MTAQVKSLVVYEIAKGKKISVPIEKESVWLTQKQIARVFSVQTPAINKHINNIYKSGELEKKRTISKMETVQQEGDRKVTRIFVYYNLDVIISVGYRVNSQRATQFRIWATSVLRDYILKGYAFNQHRIKDIGIEELERAVNLIRQTIDSRLLTSVEAKGILKVITDYAHSWVMFHKYDEGHIELAAIQS